MKLCLMCSEKRSLPLAGLQLRQDHVTDLACQPSAHRLLATSGDGNLGVLDLRTHKV